MNKGQGFIESRATVYTFISSFPKMKYHGFFFYPSSLNTLVSVTMYVTSFMFTFRTSDCSNFCASFDLKNVIRYLQVIHFNIFFFNPKHLCDKLFLHPYSLLSFISRNLKVTEKRIWVYFFVLFVIHLNTAW